MRKITHKPNARGLDQLDTSPQVLKAAALLAFRGRDESHANSWTRTFQTLQVPCPMRFGIEEEREWDKRDEPLRIILILHLPRPEGNSSACAMAA